MFQNAVLDIHPAALGVLLFPTYRLGISEVVGVFLLVVEKVFVVEQVGGFGRAHEQPGFAAEFPAISLLFAGLEHAAQVGAHRGNSGARCQHDDIGVLVVREKHLLADRTGDLHLGAGLSLIHI